MRRILSLAVVFLAVLPIAFAQTGTWSGKLNVQGMQLPLVFHLDESPTMDSPDQGARGIPVQVERTETGKITIKIPSIGATYEGQWVLKQINGTFKQMGVSFPMTLTPGEEKQNYAAAVMQLQTPYMKYFLALDARLLLGSIRCPVLALNGTKDTQVACDLNLEALRKGLSASVQIVPVEGVNHLFQHCTTGASTEYRTLEETFAPEVLNLMTHWLSKSL